MDIQLQELIDKIKKDGINSASEEVTKLKSQAEAEAKRIIEAAHKEAEEIIAKGKADAERSEKASIATVEQASRNLVLAFKGEIESLLNKITSQEVTNAYSEETLKTILPTLINAWASKNVDGLNLILSEDDLKKLNAFFDEKLSAELKKGLELKSDRRLSAGFRIGSKDGSAYYDYSAEAVAELFSAYLNPRLAELLKTAVKGK